MIIAARIALLLAGCALIGWGASQTMHAETAAEVSSERSVGFSSRVFCDGDGTHKYVLFVPHHVPPNERPPVLIYLNGRGENGDDGLMQMFDNLGPPVWEMKRRFPFIVLAYQCPIGESWTPEGPSFQRLLRILDDVMRRFHADSDRVYLAGDSSGGASVWEIARIYPDRFAAIVPVSSAKTDSTPEEVAESLVDTGMPVWTSYNRYDLEKFVLPNRAMKRGLLRAGVSPFYFENDAERHNAWSRTYRSPALYEWLLCQRVSTRTRGPFTLLEPRRLLQSSGVGGAVGWTATNDVLSAPVTKDNDAIVLADGVYTNLELHAEFRSDLLASCGIVIRTNATDAEESTEFRLLLCGPHAGTGELLKNGEFVEAIDPLAQRSLLSDDWNDVRVAVSAGVCTVSLNGWEAIRANDPEFSGPLQFGFFQAGESAKPAQWQWPRIRENHTTGTDRLEEPL